jgi:hypothetical protein
LIFPRSKANIAWVVPQDGHGIFARNFIGHWMSSKTKAAKSAPKIPIFFKSLEIT